MLQRAVERSLGRHGVAGGHLVVAVSAGVDSVSLLHSLYKMSERLSLKLLIGHVNHGLRGEESEADGAWLRELAEAWGLPLVSLRVDPESLRRGVCNRERPTLQEAARELRYQALQRMRETAGAGYIATAHNADDQAETVLLRLLRGCGPDALAGIAEHSPQSGLLRPLLRVSRKQILEYAAAHGLRWREDASNSDTHYARNRLRADWLPGLTRDFNPQLLRAIGNLADAQRRDSEWIAAAVEAEAKACLSLQDDAVHICPRGWRERPEALALRLLRHALQQLGAGRDVSRVHLERALRFLREGGEGSRGRQGRSGSAIELPGGVRLTRTRQKFVLHRLD